MRVFFALTLGLALSVTNTHLFAQEPKAITFQQLVDYLELEVKEEKILAMIADSPTKFTLGEDQLDKLRKLGASDKLIEALGTPAVVDNELSSDIRDFVIVLDASASMKDSTETGMSKWDSAKQAATDLIAAIPNGRRLAFIVYGNDQAKRCQSVELIRQLTMIDENGKKALVAKINSIAPAADTPIGAALGMAKGLVANTNELTKVILLTDGMESCKGDPVAEATQLAAMPHLQGGVDVIGYGLKPQEIAQIEKIARSGRGKFYNAKNVKSLNESVAEVERTIVAAKPAVKPVAATKPSLFTKSDTKPSKDAEKPTILKPREYVTGRLGTEKSHYFAVDLPEGEYVAICEMKPSSGNSTNIMFDLSLDDKSLVSMNEIDRLERGAAKFQSSGETLHFTLKNTADISDYNLVICKADDDFPLSGIANAGQRSSTFEVGSSVKVKLDPKSTETYEAFYDVALDEGDFELAFEFNAPKADGNYGAKIDVVDATGTKVKNIDSAYDSIKTQTIKSKLILAEEEILRLRIRVTDAPVEGVLSVKRLAIGSDSE